MSDVHETLEIALGEGLRSQRIARRLTQVDLAERANVSVGALKNLESGRGSTTSTLVRVAHALDLDHWLAAVSPVEASFNPLDLLEPRRRPSQRAPRRVRRSAS